MKIEQIGSNANRPALSEGNKASPRTIPSVRYFQVHFEYLHDILGELKKEIGELRQRLAHLGIIEGDGRIIVQDTLQRPSNELSSPRENAPNAQRKPRKNKLPQAAPLTAK
jgi:hypothetical protein